MQGNTVSANADAVQPFLAYTFPTLPRFADEARTETSLQRLPLDDTSPRHPCPSHAPRRLRRLRHGIYLQPVGAVLVRGGNRAAADAGRWRGLPVPGVFAEDGGGVIATRTAVILRCSPSVPRTQRSA